MKLKIFLSVIFLLALTFAAKSASAETTKITFPIGELGDCADQGSCKAYCDVLEHAEACMNFGLAHGLVTKDQAERTAKFAKVTGPSGCTSKEACEKFCYDAANADTCLKFAEEHKVVTDEELARMKKFREALLDKDSPGGCHDERTCRTFCEERSNNEKCLGWAKRHELIGSEEADKLDKFNQLVASDETPGGCKTKEECQTYCQDKTHFDECLKFSESMGFVQKDQAEKLRQDGMKGPGGCDSAEACKAFCNDPDNQQTCIDFGKERRLINSEQEQVIKESSAQARIGLPNARPELLDCLKSKLGVDAVTNLQAGTFAPDADTAATARECFNKAPTRPESNSGSSSGNIPPQFADCLRKVLGEEEFQNWDRGVKKPDTTRADVQECLRMQQNNTRPTTKPDSTNQPSTTVRQYPPAMKECILKLAGPEAFTKLQQGQLELTAEQKGKVVACVGQTTEPISPTGSTLKPPIITRPPVTTPPVTTPPTDFNPPTTNQFPKIVPEPFESDQ